MRENVKLLRNPIAAAEIALTTVSWPASSGSWPNPRRLTEPSGRCGAREDSQQHMPWRTSAPAFGATLAQRREDVVDLRERDVNVGDQNHPLGAWQPAKPA